MLKIKTKLAHFLTTSLLIFGLVILSGCGIPYRIDVDQGNAITQQDIAKLSIGMTKDDVILEIGNPMLNDPFNLDRWDYIQYYKNGRKQTIQQSKVSLLFKNGILFNIDNSQFKQIITEPVTY